MTARPSASCRYLLIPFVRPEESAKDYARSCLKSGLWSDGVADLYVLDTSSIFKYRKYKTTFPVAPQPVPSYTRLSPALPDASRTQPQACLGLGDRQRPPARRSEPLPHWARGSEKPGLLGETVSNEHTARSRPAMRLMQPSGTRRGAWRRLVQTMGQRARSERLVHTSVGVQHAAKTWGTAYGQPWNAIGV